MISIDRYSQINSVCLGADLLCGENFYISPYQTLYRMYPSYTALLSLSLSPPLSSLSKGFASGLMWTLANYCWFLANIYLSSMVTFPIVTAVCNHATSSFTSLS